MNTPFLRIRATLFLAFTVLSTCAIAQSRGGGNSVGTPWRGKPAVYATTAQIMARPQVQPPYPTVPKYEDSGEESDANDPMPNLLARQSSTYPEASAYQPRIQPPHPFFTVGNSFLAAQSSESGFVPPDTMGDVSPTQVLVCVNGRIKAFKRDGTLDVLNTTTDAFFLSVRNGSSTSDPRVRWDPLAQRWIVVIINVSNQNNRIMLAVSNGPTIDAGTVWAFSFFNYASPLPAPSAPSSATSFCDYPTLGVDKNAVYIGGNIFTGSFSGCDLFVIRKSDLLAGTLTVSAFRNVSTNVSGSGPFTPHGADNDDPNATEGYVLGSDRLVSGRLYLRRVSNPGGTPAISANIPLNVLTTAAALTAPQAGTTKKLDSLDLRLFAAKLFRNRITGVQTLWAAHNTGLDVNGMTATSIDRTGSRWYELQGFQTGQTFSLVQAGTVFDNAATSPNFFTIPSIAMNGQGNAALGATRSGSNSHPDAYYAYRLASDPLGILQTPIGITASTFVYGPQSGTTQRWGDYSHVNVDPADGQSLWSFEEYCNATNSWATRVTRLLAPAPGAITLSVTSGYPGDVVGLTVTGTGIFDGGPSFPKRLAGSITGSGVTLSTPTFIPVLPNPSANLSVTVSPTATPGDRLISLVNPDGQFSPAATFTVLQPKISGHVSLGDYGGDVTIPQFVVEVRDSGGNVVESVTTNLDASGNFLINQTVPAGTYTVAIKGTARFLRQTQTGLVLANSGLTGLSFSLTNGDADGDNSVGPSDLNLLRSAFGSTPTSPNWNPNADLDGDGQVGPNDLNIIRSHFGASGDN